jgi:oligopeptide/dipeptide ABC transporter ATP-binding protein
MNPTLCVDSLAVDYGSGRRRNRAVDGVSITIEPGQSVGLVGESGSGKSTVAKAIMQLERPSGGSITVDGRQPASTRFRDRAAYWADVQMVFQDPASSLNPRRTIVESVSQPLDAHRRGTIVERRERVAELLQLVGLDAGEHGHRRPHQLSGGQCQRVAIARAMALRPKLLLCDEPVSALDVSIQAQIINLLRELRQREGVSILFISHDLAVVRSIADHVAVMYRGRIVEQAATDDLYDRPSHPYTRLLLESIPGQSRFAAGPDVAGVVGPLPNDGCSFRPRCPNATEACRIQPVLGPAADGSTVACHHPVGLPGLRRPNASA